MKRNSKIAFTVIFLLVTFSLYAIFNLTQNYVFEYTIARYKLVATSKHQVNETQIILFWNNFFGEKNWGMPNETNYQDYLKSMNCPVTNCILTHDKQFLSEPHLYDAIVFHGAESWGKLDPPQTRSPHQLYVTADLE